MTLPRRENAKWGQRLLSLLALLATIAITLLIYFYRKEIQKAELLGYGGIFILSTLSNATLILPVPGVIITSVLGAVFQPLPVAFIAALGAAFGESTGYAAGFGGSYVVKNQKWFFTIEGWMKNHGELTIFLLALVPNPFFDLAGIAAGISHMSFLRYIVWCFFGKFIKMLFFAFSGSTLILIFRNFFY